MGKMARILVESGPRAYSYSVCLGRAQRGAKGGSEWRAAAGTGYVAPAKGAYARPLRLGMEVLVLLFSTFGGMSPDRW